MNYINTLDHKVAVLEEQVYVLTKTVEDLQVRLREIKEAQPHKETEQEKENHTWKTANKLCYDPFIRTTDNESYLLKRYLKAALAIIECHPLLRAEFIQSFQNQKVPAP